ncbi:MAG: hypothetical protein OXF96_04880 [Chloroflexi bacterium]|nr:hypothetical protein [Chloroflexota bacterium]
MRTLRRSAKGPHTIRAYLKPAHGWALPFDHARVRDPHALLDQGFADLMADERLAVRFIIEPAGAATVRDFRAQAERLRAERHAPPDSLGGRIRHLGSSLWWGVRQRASLSLIRLDASAVEEKARAQLLTMQIHLWVQAATRDLAEGRMMWLRQGFDACASWRNWLRRHEPWRRRRFDRCFAGEGSWPGATFVVSLDEACVLTGLPRLVLATLSERQVWTRWSGGGGEMPGTTGPHSGEGPDA